MWNESSWNATNTTNATQWTDTHVPTDGGWEEPDVRGEHWDPEDRDDEDWDQEWENEDGDRHDWDDEYDSGFEWEGDMINLLDETMEAEI